MPVKTRLRDVMFVPLATSLLRNTLREGLFLVASQREQVIAILKKYGGSLYIADPACCFINSNATNQCSVDTPVGYVQDLCGNRAITQPTSSAKPILKKVPTKLGSELVPNGDFSGPLGPQWNTPVGYSIANGQLVIGAAAVQWGGIVNIAVPPPVIGKSYQLSSVLVSGSSNDAALRYGDGVVLIGRTGTFTCQGAGWGQIMPAAANGTANSVVDNVSIKEVLEWGWAWEFDGVNDILELADVAVPAQARMIVASLAGLGAGSVLVNKIAIGVSLSEQFLNCQVYGAAYTPVVMMPADMVIVRDYFSKISGIQS